MGKKQLVLVGNGMAGVRAIEEILREEALSESWRESFLKKRDRLTNV